MHLDEEKKDAAVTKPDFGTAEGRKEFWVKSTIADGCPADKVRFDNARQLTSVIHDKLRTITYIRQPLAGSARLAAANFTTSLTPFLTSLR